MDKQDILNAFREHFVFELVNHKNTAYGTDDQRENISNWLLNTLTEFERETIKDVLWLIDCEDDCAKTDGEDTKILSNLKNRIGGHFELEKEKHPSK